LWSLSAFALELALEEALEPSAEPEALAEPDAETDASSPAAAAALELDEELAEELTLTLLLFVFVFVLHIPEHPLVLQLQSAFANEALKANAITATKVATASFFVILIMTLIVNTLRQERRASWLNIK